MKNKLIIAMLLICGVCFAQNIDGILEIPEGITKVGDAQYRNNSEIISIDFPSSVEKIGTMSFRNCSSLQSVSIPGTVKVIGDWAFAQNAQLVFADLLEGVESIGECAFYKCPKLQSVTIPSSVKSIGKYFPSDIVVRCEAGSYAESWAKNNGNPCEIIGVEDDFLLFIEEVDIGCGKTIKNNAFENCISLKKVMFPPLLENIGEKAFYNTALEEVVIPQTVTKIGFKAFPRKTRLIVYPHSYGEKWAHENGYEYKTEKSAGIYLEYSSIEELKQIYKDNCFDSAVFSDNSEAFSQNYFLDAPYNPGITSQNYRKSVETYFNFYRTLAGLSSVSLSSSITQAAQVASLVNAVNGTIAYNPQVPKNMSEELFSLAKKGITKSCLGKAQTIFAAFDLFVANATASDKALGNLGNRRLLLNPALESFGFGAVEHCYTLAAQGEKNYDVSSHQQVVCWPPKYMPLELVEANQVFSVSLGSDYSFTDEVVISMKRLRDGKVFNFSSKDGDDKVTITKTKVGLENCLAWRFFLEDEISEGDEFFITIDGIAYNGEKLYPLEYTVTYFSISK